MSKKSTYLQPGFLWDGKKHLSGKLEITDDTLTFHFDHFKESNLNLNIPLADIQEVAVFKLYGLTTNGLQVTDKTGHTNQFILEDPVSFKDKIQ